MLPQQCNILDPQILKLTSGLCHMILVWSRRLCYLQVISKMLVSHIILTNNFFHQSGWQIWNIRLFSVKPQFVFLQNIPCYKQSQRVPSHNSEKSFWIPVRASDWGEWEVYLRQLSHYSRLSPWSWMAYVTVPYSTPVTSHWCLSKTEWAVWKKKRQTD